MLGYTRRRSTFAIEPWKPYFVLQCLEHNTQVYFSFCPTSLNATISYELKRDNYRCRNLNHHILFLIKITSGGPDLLLVTLNILWIRKKLYLAECLIQKSGDSTCCNFLISELCHGCFWKFYKIFRTQMCLKPSSRTHFANK